MTSKINAKSVSFSLVFWHKPKNKRNPDEYGDAKKRADLIQSFADTCWSNHFPATVYEIDKEGITLALKERQTVWDTLKQDQSETGKLKLRLFEECFTKSGKLVSPAYYGNSGFRRSECLFDGMVKRVSEEIGKADFSIPVVVKSYDNEINRILDQQLENGMAELGTVRLSDLNQLQITKDLFGMGAIENNIRQLYGSTMAQKLYGLCTIDNHFPELKLLERFKLDPKEKKFLPLSSFRHNSIVTIKNRVLRTIKEKAGKGLSAAEQKVEPINLKQLEDWCKDVKTGSGQAKPIMEKKNIETLSTNHDLNIAKTVASAVLDNDTGKLEEFRKFSDQINTVTDLVAAGKGENLKSLVSLADYPQITLAINAALKNGVDDKEIVNAIQKLHKGK